MQASDSLAQVTLKKQQTAQGERRYAKILMSRVGGIKRTDQPTNSVYHTYERNPASYGSRAQRVGSTHLEWRWARQARQRFGPSPVTRYSRMRSFVGSSINEPQAKAAPGRRTPKSCAPSRCLYFGASILECAGPAALWPVSRHTLLANA